MKTITYRVPVSPELVEDFRYFNEVLYPALVKRACADLYDPEKEDVAMASRHLRKTTISLPCKLDRDELADRSKRLAILVEKVESARRRTKEVAADLKAEADRIASERDDLARVVASEQEEREVSVEDFADDVRGVVTRVRMDTGEVVSERALRAEERQLDLASGD